MNQQSQFGKVIRIVAFAVDHGAWKHAYGYRFEAPGRVIVISGDTTYSKSLIQAAKGCDILVHEVYSEKGLANRTPDWQRYHAAFHTSAPDVGRIAAEVQPKKLVLYHLLPWVKRRRKCWRKSAGTLAASPSTATIWT